MPPVDSEGQRAAHPDVVERLPLVVRGDQVSTVPVTLLNGELAAERGSKLVARCWRTAVGILAQDLDYVLVDMTFDLDLGSYRDGLGMMAIAARGSALANHRTEV
jgi:hypothetical protein